MSDDDFYDDEHDPPEEIWEEIGFVEEAAKKLIHLHPDVYRKLVEAIDIKKLNTNIEQLKGEIYKRDRDIAKLKAKNPGSANVPALQETVKALQAEIDRLEGKPVREVRKRKPKKGA